MSALASGAPALERDPDISAAESGLAPGFLYEAESALWALRLLAPEYRPELEKLTVFLRRGAFDIS